MWQHPIGFIRIGDSMSDHEFDLHSHIFLNSPLSMGEAKNRRNSYFKDSNASTCSKPKMIITINIGKRHTVTWQEKCIK